MLKQDLVTKDQLNTVNKMIATKGGRKKLVSYLLDLGMDRHKLEEFFLVNFDVSTINLSTFEISTDSLHLLTRDQCEKYCVIPVTKMDNVLIVASSDPTNINMKEDLSHLVRSEVKLVFATEKQITSSIEHYYVTGYAYTTLLTNYETEVLQDLEEEEEKKIDILDTDPNANLPTVVKFINLMLLDSIKKGASDIHIEPYEDSFRVRFRIDGKLHEIIKPDKAIAFGLINRIKVMSNLAIEESRRPQDGRIKVGLKDGELVDFRVSILPTLFGQKCVMRLLNSDSVSLNLEQLGLEDHQLELFRKAISQPYGIILLTGPTGSGKTTTIYSALTELNKPDVNISTVEDPVEINVSGINQVQVNKAVKLDFAAALRSLLRQDPDIMMIGEIRDYETAEIAIKAALTGHLVISTIHTNDAPSTITRFDNMGVQPFMVASSLNLVIAQRLVRKVCKDCAEPKNYPKEPLLKLGLSKKEIENATFLEGSGCLSCSGVGYNGRVAIYEVLNINEQIKDAIFKGLALNELKKICINSGMQSLLRSALNKLVQGVTTMKEVIEVCFTDESENDEGQESDVELKKEAS